MRKIDELKAMIKKLVDECDNITFLTNLCRLIQAHYTDKE